MSRVLLEIDETAAKPELFKFLKENKKALIAQKKAVVKQYSGPGFIFKSAENDLNVTTKSGSKRYVKANPGISTEVPDDAVSIEVTVAANTSMFCDSVMDVLLKGAGKASMRERKGLIPHIHDHLWETDAEVGDVKSIYYQDIPLKDLGYNGEGTAQVLVFNTVILRDYNERIFKMYYQGRVKQHSIGLRYLDIQLAINAPDDDYYEDEYKVWKKYIDQIINKEVAENAGYFWVVPQFMLLENSCVLLGANELTPTLTTSEAKTTKQQPGNDPTEVEPEEENVFDLKKAIAEVKIIF